MSEAAEAPAPDAEETPKPKRRSKRTPMVIELDPIEEARAVAGLRNSIAELNGDDELLLDMVEGQTSLFEAIDMVLQRMIVDDNAVIAGCEATMEILESRRERAKQRQKEARTLLEQALVTAGVEVSIARPLATVGLSKGKLGFEVTAESEIQAAYWRRPPAPDPVIDKKAITDALYTKDEDDKVVATGISIPGVVRTNGAPTLNVRLR